MRQYISRERSFFCRQIRIEIRKNMNNDFWGTSFFPFLLFFLPFFVPFLLPFFLTAFFSTILFFSYLLNKATIVPQPLLGPVCEVKWAYHIIIAMVASHTCAMVNRGFKSYKRAYFSLGDWNTQYYFLYWSAGLCRWWTTARRGTCNNTN